MEVDCQKSEAKMVPAQGITDMNALFEAISTKYTSETSKITKEVQQVIQANEDFKQAVREELDKLRNLVLQHNGTVPQIPSVTYPASTTSSLNATPCTSMPVPVTLGNGVTTSTTSIQDVQAQMMLMMMESFSKLSMAFSEGKSESKPDWPKFSGDSKNFRSWYMGIMTQISLPPWSDLYDSSTHDVVASTSSTMLNGKLYSKIILALEGTAYKNFVSHKHLHADGIMLLKELVQTYKPRNVPEIVAAKTVEFWGSMKRLPMESIDLYYGRFQELLDDLADADEPISMRAAIRQFIFTLGPEFDSIQNNFRINNLPQEWRTQNWPNLLALCRDYYNSVKLQLSHRRLQLNMNDQSGEREAHQKKVRTWFLNPSKYCQEIESMQLRHPGKCIYHLAESHPTDRCGVKKECDEIVANKKNDTGASAGLTASSGKLRHIMDDSFVDAECKEAVEPDFESSGNSTNEDALLYFARISKH